MDFIVIGKPQGEVWKDIKGYEGIYQISNFGNVKSNDQTIIKSNGVTVCPHLFKGRVLHPFITGKGYKNGGGYLSIRLKGKQHKVHRLVAEAFIKNPDNLPQVNHKDGNTRNNCVDNIEWCTAKANVEHSVAIGSHAVGENVKNAKLTYKQVEEIRATYICGDKTYGAKPLSRKYGVSPTTIKNIVKMRKWRYGSVWSL